jgi:hypothetical protein
MYKNNRAKEVSLEKNNTNIISKIVYILIILAVAIISCIIAVLAIKLTCYFGDTRINFAGEESDYKSENFVLNTLFVAITILGVYLIYKIISKINAKILLAISIIITMAIGLIWVNTIQFKPVADQQMVKFCAESILDNDLADILEPGEYLNRNPHQLGFVLYIMAIFKIFNTRSDLLLQTLNIIYSTLNGVILYFICKSIFKEEKVQKIALIFITFFSLYWAFLDTYIYGNVPGLTFGLLAILFTVKYLDNHKFYNIPIIALSLCIAYLLKSNYEIFLCAILIIIFFDIINTKKIMNILGIVLIFITVFGIRSLVYNVAEKKLGYSLDEGVPMLSYIYMGISEPATLPPGWYNSTVEEIYTESNYDTEKSKEITDQLLEDRVEALKSNSEYTWNYFYTKFQTTWLNPTFQTIWCSIPSTLMDSDEEYQTRILENKFVNDVLFGDYYAVIEKAMDLYEDIIFIFAGVGLILLLAKMDFKNMILPLTFLGGFIFHIIWETKAVYVIQYFFIMIPISAFGMYKVFTIIENLIKKVIHKNEKNV